MCLKIIEQSKQISAKKALQMLSPAELGKSLSPQRNTFSPIRARGTFSPVSSRLTTARNSQVTNNVYQNQPDSPNRA